MLRSCPQFCRNVLMGCKMLRLQLPSPCLQKCGPSSNANTVGTGLLAVPSLGICKLLSVFCRKISNSWQHTLNNSKVITQYNALYK